LENGLLINDPGRLLLSKFTHEKEYLLKHTSLIRSTNDLEDMDSYPEPVRKIISKVNKLGAQWLLKKLL
jgi:CDP-diacylglycerol--serine O-phosphatidyltransferase